MTDAHVVDGATLLSLTAEIVIAHLDANQVAADELPRLITSVHEALAGLGAEAEEDDAPKPAVSVRTSIKPDYLVCLEDGRKLKTLKRHLMTSYGMTPDQYRARWNLPADYPMVAPAYAARRSELAKANGLGRKKAGSTLSAAPEGTGHSDRPANVAGGTSGSRPSSRRKRGKLSISV
ncbi:MAG: hypothetical protein B7Y88_13215 [Sphingomonadales bacterium 32-64-17]|nr:MAG: hypothetical protein B7Y88_13215 [Sphingomonadales bacterium 32-64-17]